MFHLHYIDQTTVGYARSNRFLPLSTVLFPVALLSLATLHAEPLRADERLAPVIVGPWTQIVGNPNVGEFTTDRQQPVDFAVWQAADGTWQAWSCIRKTSCGGHTRLFHGWESDELTSPDWKPLGIVMQADPSLGEDAGGLQAPHVVKVGDTYHMFYGDWNYICHATSKDGKKFTRVVQPSGKTGMFTEGPGNNTRDVMLLKVGDLWHAYYTAYPTRQGADFVRTTSDFEKWSEPTVVAFGGIAGTDPFSAECPHVVHRHGKYYLFRTQQYGQNNITSVYCSDDPKMFGINQDDRYLITRLPVAAPEIVQHDGRDYIVALNLGLDGLRIARLDWQPATQIGSPVFPLDKAADRQQWKVESGNIPSALTDSRRSEFTPPQKYFVGTAELQDRGFDDARTGAVRSPEFDVTSEQYFAYVSGGADLSKLYVAIVDAKSGKELLRFGSQSDTNRLEPQRIDTTPAVGHRAYLRIVDEAREGWGHINFGGLYTAE